MGCDRDQIEKLIVELLKAIGEDPTREGLADTPKRVAKWWREFIDYDAGSLATCFEHVESAGMVTVSGMRVWSLCEHHLLPFWCDVAIAYIPHDRVLGLSKFGRIAHKHAHKLQIQERLVAGIASEITELSGAPDVAVVGRGEHLCMTMRGVKTPSVMTTTVFTGVFEERMELRRELLQLVAA